MHPNTPQDDHQATIPRKHFCCLRAQTQPSTEYRERYISPHCHAAIALSAARRDPHPGLKGTNPGRALLREHFCSVRAQTQPSTEYREQFRAPPRTPGNVLNTAHRNPDPTLKGTTSEMAPLRSKRGAYRCPKHAPNNALSADSTKYHRRCSSITHLPARMEEDHRACTAEDYTTVYKNDFQPWNVKKRQPYKQPNSLTVNQGLVVTGNHASKGVQRKPKPIESITSYRSDYIPHPVLPIRRVKPPQSTKGLLSEPAVSSEPRTTWDANQDVCDRACAFFDEFTAWSLKNKFCGECKDGELGPPPVNPNLQCSACEEEAKHRCCCLASGLPPTHTLQALTNRRWSNT